VLGEITYRGIQHLDRLLSHHQIMLLVIAMPRMDLRSLLSITNTVLAYKR